MSDLTGVTNWKNLVLPLAVSGVGMGLVMAPTTTVVMASTPVEQSGMGAGILSTTRQIGTMLGLSVLGAVLQNQLSNNVSRALTKIPVISESIRTQIVNGLQSGGIGSTGINIPGTIPDTFKTQLRRPVNPDRRLRPNQYDILRGFIHIIAFPKVFSLWQQPLP